MKKLYPLFISLLTPFLLCGQDDLVVKGQVTVEPNGLLHVEGNVNIHSTGTLDIQASGLMRVKKPSGVGTWICDGTTMGGGDVEFAGSNVDYSVSGSKVSFPNLILNFGALAGGIVPEKMTLNDSIRVDGKLTLTKGRIVTSGANEIYMADSATDAIVGNFGADKSRYIEGTLRREVRTGANSYYRFPIGGPSGSGKRGYNPASVDLRTSIGAVKPSAAKSLSGKFVEQSDIGNIGFQTSVGGGHCYYTTAFQFFEFYWMVHNFGYWEFKPQHDSLSGGWNYDFYVFPDEAYLFYENPNLTHLKIFKAPGSTTPGSSFNWDPYFLESGNPCNGVKVESNQLYWIPDDNIPFAQTDSIAAWGLKSFSNFGLGGGGGAGLPIELLYLKAYPVDNKYIQVEWMTETEINNSGFDVMRSADGVNFTKIGWRDGAGNSSVRRTYGYPDEDVVPNQLYYYYLRSIDYDGSADSTYVVTAMITEAETFTISEFIPNPSENDSRLEVISSREKYLNITVYNTLGQVIMGRDHRVVAGTNTIDFDFNLLADGTYYAIIKADNEFFNRKLILTK